MSPIPNIVLTTGEPAGIGPDIVLSASCKNWEAQLIALGDRRMLASRAETLGLEIQFADYSSGSERAPHQPGRLQVIDLPLSAHCSPGTLATENAGYVLAQLDMAIEGCRADEFSAMVTAPVHKGIINEAGIPFSGHTEYLASATDSEHALMLLAAGDLRVALATTHLALSAVPEAITQEGLERAMTTLCHALETQFGLPNPQITVLGLNPHAGESGHLGREEIEIIEPVCERLRNRGLRIRGPVSADTAFLPSSRAQTDAYLAMYHDQGLPILKTLGFHEAVNITLGLPFTRVSVDHGTALELAGTGDADDRSLRAAIGSAIAFSQRSPSGS